MLRGGRGDAGEREGEREKEGGRATTLTALRRWSFPA